MKNVINLTEYQLECSSTLSKDTTGIPGIIWLFEDENKIAFSNDLTGKDALFIYLGNLEISGEERDFDNGVVEKVINFTRKNSFLIKLHAKFDITTDKLIDSIVK